MLTWSRYLLGRFSFLRVFFLRHSMDMALQAYGSQQTWAGDRHRSTTIYGFLVLLFSVMVCRSWGTGRQSYTRVLSLFVGRADFGFGVYMSIKLAIYRGFRGRRTTSFNKDTHELEGPSS